MALPLVALAGLYGLTSMVGASANLYSQYKQREYLRYQRSAYERQIADYERNVGRSMRYPELGPYGQLKRIDTGIAQSYAGSVGTLSGLTSSLGTSAYYGSKSSGLYSSHGSKSSRYL